MYGHGKAPHRATLYAGSASMPRPWIPFAACLSADEREPQEREGFRFAEPLLFAVGRRMATKLNQPGLVRMERQRELLKSCSHRIEEVTIGMSLLFIAVMLTLWLGTAYSGLHRFDPASGRITVYRHNRQDLNGLRDNTVPAVYVRMPRGPGAAHLVCVKRSEDLQHIDLIECGVQPLGVDAPFARVLPQK